MKHLKIAFITVWGLSSFLSSCGPDNGMDCSVVCDKINSAPHELLDYFVFSEGSYWVYQLNGTDTFDTLTFSGIREEFFELKASCNRGIPPCEMRYSVGFNHSNLTKFPPSNVKNNSSNEGYYVAYSQNRDQWDVEHVSGNKAVSSLNFFLAYPFEINQQYSETTFLKDTASEITVPSGTFKCIETQSQVADPEATIMSMHWARKIGLVHYQISIDQTWELIGYQLK
jgi:hypothetical protein